MPLGRYMIGTVIHLLVFVDWPWAQDGGVYHIGADYSEQFKVIYRGESSISQRLKFYGYIDPASTAYGFLYATWDNESPSESHTNGVRITVSSNGYFYKNQIGNFASANELTSIFVIQSNSENVGIGTTTPTEKLSVNGTIRSKEVKVEANNWPDYVFATDYALPTLSETETYIQENHRLPNMPSAEEVVEKGIALGEMNRLVVEKLEELTLHIIKLEKENRILKQNLARDQTNSQLSPEVKELTLQIKQLENRLTQLENDK